MQLISFKTMQYFINLNSAIEFNQSLQMSHHEHRKFSKSTTSKNVFRACVYSKVRVPLFSINIFYFKIHHGPCSGQKNTKSE